MEEAIRKAEVLIEALPYIRHFGGKPVVIKFGGAAMESPAVLDEVLGDVVFLATVGIRPVVVHGGGPQISEAMKRTGLTPRFVQGHRVTDAEALQVVVRVLTEQISADLIRRIGTRGGQGRPAFGDGRSLLTARKKLFADPADPAAEPLDLGYVGEIVSVDSEALLALTEGGAVAVVPPVGQDETGQLYNVNGDTAAGAVAAALAAEKVVFLSDVHGIMAEPGNPDSLLSTLDEREMESLVAGGVISGGMMPKIAACLAALHGGVRKAHIIDGRLPHSLLLEIFTDRGVGTEILKHPTPA